MVSLVPGTNLMLFTYQHQEAESAQERSQALAGAYLEYRRREALGSMFDQANELKAQLDNVEQDLKAFRRRAQRADDPIRVTALESFAGVLEGVATRIEFELSRLSDLPPVGSIVQPAHVPSSPGGQLGLLAATFGVLVGLVVGLLYASRASRLADKALTLDQLEALGGAPVLARVPRPPRWRRGSSLVAEKGMSELAGAYRLLRTHVMSRLEMQHSRSLLVTSPGRFDGKDVTAANLGLVTARPGRKALLVSADLRRGGVSKLFGCAGRQGLSDVLLGRASLEGCLVELRPDLELLPAGSKVDDPAALLGGEEMGELLGALEQRYDFVIVSSPHVLGLADSLALVGNVPSVLLVVDGHAPDEGSLYAARTQLEQVGASLLGMAWYQPPPEIVSQESGISIRLRRAS